MHNAFYLPTMVGVFGSFDTFAPLLTYVIWYGLVLLLFAAAALLAGWRERLTLFLFAVAMLLVPVIISSSQVHRYGYTWNGRDTLPFAVGLPIVAAAVLERRLGSKGISKIVGVSALLAGLASFAAFYEALRRYAVGSNGAIVGFLAASKWQPPGGVVFVLFIEATVLILGGTLLYRVARADRAPAASVESAHRSQESSNSRT